MTTFPIAIVGPTAIGKSSIAIQLALCFNGEIVNVDSMQIYRGMNIGTAKPGAEERSRVPHHLLDIASPYEDFSVALYQVLGREAVDGIISRGRFPFLVGGSGLYLRALLDEMDFPPPSPRIRERFYSLPEEDARSAAYEELRRMDPQAAELLGPHNLRRLVRALEIRESVGEKAFHQRLRFREIGQHYPLCLVIGLATDRALLCERIESRVEEMFSKGLVEEARELQAGGRLSRTARQALGYRQVFDYLEGVRGLEETIRLVKTATKRYAKRQMTWFRGDSRTKWVSLDKEHLTDSGKAAARIAAVIEDFLERRERLSG